MQVLRFNQSMLDTTGYTYQLINRTTGRFDFFNQEICLQKAILNYSWQSINARNQNNVITVTWPNATVYTITIPSGNYAVSDLNAIIASGLLAQGVSAANSSVIQIAYNANVNRVTLKISPESVTGLTPQLTFGAGQNFCSLLGFSGNQSYPATQQSTPYIINAQSTPNLSPQGIVSLVINLVSSDWSNPNTRANVIDTFAPNVPFGSQIVEEPRNPCWFRIEDESYPSVSLYISDSMGNPISLDAGIEVIEHLVRGQTAK